MISIILPIFNEEKNIGFAIDDISNFFRKSGLAYEIIAVNDGSKDKTEEVLNNQKDIIIISHPHNLGYGSALRSGFNRAKGDLVFFTDSDRQFDIRDIALFLERIENYDFIIGYRRNRHDPYIRALHARIFRLIALIFFGIKAKDVNCAFKLFKRNVIESMELTSSGALINLEILTLAKKRKHTFLELPVKHFPRTSGVQTGGSFKVISKALSDLFVFWLRNNFS